MIKFSTYFTLVILSTTLLATGCMSAVNSNAICDATSAIRTEHAAALAVDGGDKSVVTGARLIAMIDGACR